MARPRRYDLPHTFYHVLSRGNQRQPIFENDADREKFLDLLSRLPQRFGVEVWSYVLMGNHYHLILKNLDGKLSRGMQWFGTSYTSYFNWKWGRTGHLFQGRFKSFVIEEESYLRQLILYIHRNPLRAGMVERLSDYGWSSYRCLGYGRQCFLWLERERVLRLFGSDQGEFRSQVQSYSEEESSLLEDLRHGLLLGSEKASKKLRSLMDDKSVGDLRQAKGLKRAEGLEGALDRVSTALELSREEFEMLKRPVRGIERPMRDIVIYLVWKDGSFPLAEIGEKFQVGYTGISNARVRGEAAIQKDQKLRAKLARLGLFV